jgi:hypothetical protein
LEKTSKLVKRIDDLGQRVTRGFEKWAGVLKSAKGVMMGRNRFSKSYRIPPSRPFMEKNRFRLVVWSCEAMSTVYGTAGMVVGAVILAQTKVVQTEPL